MNALVLGMILGTGAFRFMLSSQLIISFNFNFFCFSHDIIDKGNSYRSIMTMLVVKLESIKHTFGGNHWIKNLFVFI